MLVTGAGPIGTLTVVALHARGIDDVTVSEPNPLRRAIAERLGAKTVSPEDLVRTTGGSGLRFDAVIETSGNPKAVTAGVRYPRSGGFPRAGGCHRAADEPEPSPHAHRRDHGDGIGPL